jgi:hypothetical protein
MMSLTAQRAGATEHRHCDTPQDVEPGTLTDEGVRRAVRQWEVKVLLEEVHAFGLRPPLGLRSLLDLFVEGEVTQTEIQAYLDQQLAAPVRSITLEVRHA